MQPLTHSTTLQVTTKGQRHNPRPSAMQNHLSWQAVLATASKQPATVAAIVQAIQAANPNNQGNAAAYVKYMLRNGHLAAVQPAKAAN